MNNGVINDIASLVGSGITPLRSNDKYWDMPCYPWLKTEQLGEFQIFDTSEYISQAALEETSIKLWPPKTLSVAMYGEGQTRGNASIIMNEMTTNQACCNIVVDESKADYRYVYYWLKNSYLQLRILASGVRKNLNSDDIKSFSISYPSVPLQTRIADVIFCLDEKIALNKRINAELEAMAKTIYNYWFVQFDFPDENGKPYRTSGGAMVWNKELKCEIPATWETTTINDVIAVKDGTHDSPKAVETGYPLITSKHLMEWGLDFLSANLISESDYISINKRSKVDSGDILFSMIGSVGTVYKIDEKDISFAIKNVALYKTSENEEYKNFVYMWLKSYYMKSYMSNVLSGSIQKFIGLGDLRTMPIFVPNYETKSYYRLTRSIFEKSSIIREENQELTKLRDWLLPMLMNGQATVEEEISK